jgi:hypothetical protein
LTSKDDDVPGRADDPDVGRDADGAGPRRPEEHARFAIPLLENPGASVPPGENEFTLRCAPPRRARFESHGELHGAVLAVDSHEAHAGQKIAPAHPLDPRSSRPEKAARFTQIRALIDDDSTLRRDASCDDFA